MWAKTLTTAILLVAGGLTAVCAGYRPTFWDYMRA